MRDYLIPFQSPDGQRRSVSIHQIPSLFSEGMDDAEPLVVRPWQKMSVRFTKRLERVLVQLKFQLDPGVSPSASVLKSGIYIRLHNQKLIG